MAAHIGGFFKTLAPHGQKQGNDYGVINVGGEQFHAVAVALIDHLQNGLAINDAALKKILGRFAQYFPQYITNDAYLTTPKERMGRLLNNSRKSELVESMAYVLRQITIDEVYADPLNLIYRDIFSGLTADTPKSYLRNFQSKLPACALKALEHALDLPITLSFKEPGKELRKQERAANQAQHALVLQVQGDQYYPSVKRKADFTYVGQLAVTVKPVKVSSEQESLMAETLAAIVADNQEILRAYEQQRNTILSMVVAGELSGEQLIEHYIALLPSHANNASFIIQMQQAAHPTIAGTPEGSEQRTIGLLADALASWIASGSIKEDQLFDRIENTSKPSVLSQ